MPPLVVLVVDDEPLIRWALSQRLEAAGCSVLEAEDGYAALQQFGVGVDAVLLDLRLPDADGVDLLRQFKGLDPSTRVIVMSAYVTPEVEREARGLGAEDIVSKPFDIDRLVGRITMAAMGTA